MTADVHAMARERLAEALADCEATDPRLKPTPTYRDLADAALAVLPELLGDERVVQAAYNGAYRAWESGTPETDLRKMARIAVAAAAETLAGAS